MGRVKLQLLGEARAFREDGADIAVTGRKAVALLAYLASNPKRRCTRDRLAALLWSDRGEEQARHSLRQTVFSLHKALNDENGSILVSDGDRLTLNDEAISSDVQEFEQLSATHSREALERARSLYAGDLLEGFDVESEGFDEWLAAERARLRDLAADALQRLTQIYQETADWSAALDCAQQLVAFDPLREEGHRALMRVYDRTGRRSLALRQYRICEESLKRELDAAPSPETYRLHAEIRARSGTSGEPTAATHEGASAPRPLPEPAPSPALPPVGADARPEAVPIKPAWRRIWLLAAAVPVVVAAAALAWVYLRGAEISEVADTHKMALPLPEKPSIAILPFEELGADSSQDRFAVALTDDITTALSIISEMFVIDRNSALVYQGKRTRVRAVAEELGVRYVLEGTVQKSGDHVRVSVELIDALTGHQTWVERYEREVKDIFALQDEITLAVITALQVHITEGEQERISLIHGTHNLQAWMLAGRGLLLLRHLAQDDNNRARELYRQAAQLDPNYPGAWDGLAWCHLIDVRFGWSPAPETDLATAAALAQKTLALDPMRARTYALLGTINLIAADHVQAITYGEKSIALDPNGAEIAALFALTLTYTGDAERGVSLATKAMRLSPYYPDWYRWVLARAYRLAGRYKEAERALVTPSSGPESVLHLVELTATYSEMGRVSDAQATATEILRIDPAFSVLGWTWAPPYRDPATTKHEIEILHRAGLHD
jgi:TolB-like protein/DNA-binding SARP family transcriptional activator/Flp pilus assembly protein TadD